MIKEFQDSLPEFTLHKTGEEINEDNKIQQETQIVSIQRETAEINSGNNVDVIEERKLIESSPSASSLQNDQILLTSMATKPIINVKMYADDWSSDS